MMIANLKEYMSFKMTGRLTTGSCPYRKLRPVRPRMHNSAGGEGREETFEFLPKLDKSSFR